MMDIKEVWPLWFIIFLTKGNGSTLANKYIPENEQLAEELHKPIIRKFEKREVYSAFKDNIWPADLADI